MKTIKTAINLILSHIVQFAEVRGIRSRAIQSREGAFTFEDGTLEPGIYHLHMSAGEGMLNTEKVVVIKYVAVKEQSQFRIWFTPL